MTPTLFDGVPPTKAEAKRLVSALKGIEAIMQDGQWWSSMRLKWALHDRYGLDVSESTVTAKVRDLRKAKHGGYRIDSDRTSGHSGRRQHWIYRMVLGGVG